MYSKNNEKALKSSKRQLRMEKIETDDKLKKTKANQDALFTL